MSRDQSEFADVRRCTCGQPNKVIETRMLNGMVVRRRECNACGDIRITHEIDHADFWEHVRLRNYRALEIAAKYLSREADRLQGISPEDTEGWKAA